MNRANLILNGEIDKEWLNKRLSGKLDIFCTDGAFNKISGLDMTIAAVLGDLDSLDDSLKSKVTTVLLDDQDYTDFEKAIDFLKSNYDFISIYGASGMDVDHFLDNLSVAKKYHEKIDLIFHEREQYYFFAKNPAELYNVKDKIISIMPFPEMKSVSSQGLKYPLNGMDLALGRRTSTRNLATDNDIIISYDSGCGIIIIER